MNDLKKALLLRKKYNEIPFDEFAEMVENHISKKIPTIDKKQFKFTGLLNVDFFEIWTEL